MSSSYEPVSLQTLPLDIFQHNLLSYLSYTDLANLSSSSKSLHQSLNTVQTWQAFLRHRHYIDITQTKPLSCLPLRLRAAIGRRADLGWENHTFNLTNVFSKRWQRKCLPRLDISSEFIAVGVGADMHIHWIPEQKIWQRQQLQEKEWMVYNLGKHGQMDITEIIPLSGGGDSTEFIIGQANGFIRHIVFKKDSAEFSVKRTFQHPRAIIRSLSITEEYMVALSSTSSNTHQISFYPLQGIVPSTPEEEDTVPLSPEISPIHTESPPLTEPWISIDHSTIEPHYTTSYPTRPWNALFLSPSLLALGSTSPSALQIYDFYPSSQLQLSRQLHSHPAQLSGLTDSPSFSKTSIYAMHHYTPSLLLTGWYHGPANLHDLRLATSYPVLALNDPLDDGAAYSVSADGGNRILVGGANHGMVKVFDIRMPDKGWSIYLARERSPVYAVKGEHSRIFAATEGTVWECDLTYKHKPRNYEEDNWRIRSRWGRRAPAPWGRRVGAREEDTLGAQIRLHYGNEKLYRADGSEIGRASTTAVA